jgi:hypothetical protein
LKPVVKILDCENFYVMAVAFEGRGVGLFVAAGKDAGINE